MDKQKADELITGYLQKIYGFAVKKSFSYEEAEDLAAEIVKEVYLSLLAAKEVVNTEGYVWRISEYTYARYVASKKRHEGISLDCIEIPVWEDYALDDPMEEIAKLRREIAFLSRKRRKTIYLFYYKNKSVSCIAQALGIPEGTVKWHLNKARNELKEGMKMERKIGKLGIAPLENVSFGHSGTPGTNGGPEFYLGDKLNLNIVYSVYHTPRTKEEIAEELGVTLVYIEDKLKFLESNGFLVKTSENRYTTYVCFSPETYSLELSEKKLKTQMKIAEILAKDYVPAVQAAMAGIDGVYIPSGNRELLDAAAIFYGITEKCRLSVKNDISNYNIKTTDGGNFIAYVDIPAERSDPAYKPTLNTPNYWTCGSMTRGSLKYPAVFSWSIDSRLCAREGSWENNLTEDYEYLYEFINKTISDNTANREKFKRLRERKFLTENGQVNIMVVKGAASEFFKKIPSCNEQIKDKFADTALEFATAIARNYPPQMQDLVIAQNVSGFIRSDVAMMVMDILYGNGTFRALTPNEKVTSTLLMFSDILP